MKLCSVYMLKYQTNGSKFMTKINQKYRLGGLFLVYDQCIVAANEENVFDWTVSLTSWTSLLMMYRDCPQRWGSLPIASLFWLFGVLYSCSTYTEMRESCKNIHWTHSLDHKLRYHRLCHIAYKICTAINKKHLHILTLTWGQKRNIIILYNESSLVLNILYIFCNSLIFKKALPKRWLA